MSTIDPQIYLYGTSAVLTAGLVLRSIFANAIIGKALKEVQPTVDKFQQAYVAPLEAASRENVEKLNLLLTTANNNKRLYISEYEKMKMKEIGEPPRDRLMNAEFEAMGKTLLWSFAGVEAYNFAEHYAVHIKDMAKAGGKTIPVDEAVNVIDAHIIAALDKMGLSEVVMQATQGIGAHISQGVADLTLNALHHAMLPGVVPAFISVIREGRLLFDGTTNWQDAALYGLLPAIGRAGIVKAGMIAGGMIDVKTAGLTHGWGAVGGAVVGSWGATVGYKKYIKNQIEEDKYKLRPHLQRVEAQTEAGFEAINTVIIDKISKISNLRSSCPDVEGDEKLMSLFAKMAQAANTDLEAARNNIETDYVRLAEKIPAPHWLERLVRIDKGALVKDLYRKAANDQIRQLQGIQTQLVKAIEENPSGAANILLSNQFLKNGALKSFLETMPTDLSSTAASYDSALKSWGQTCKTHWIESQEAVAAETEVQNSMMQTLRDELAKVVNPLRVRIKTNCGRIGQPPDPIIYAFGA